MKRRMIGMAAVLLAMGLLVGCGKQAGDSKTPVAESSSGENEGIITTISLQEVDVDQYVTLGEYKGMQVKVSMPEVSQRAISALANDIYMGAYPADMGVMDRAVELGDGVNIDYVGKKNDVPFDGGSAVGSNLLIGSQTFIDGFEDGLIGAMPGDSVDLNLTFPEDYGNLELAGQDVVFTVLVNYIIPAEKDLKVISSLALDGVSSFSDLEQYASDYLKSSAQNNYESNVENQILLTFMDNCTFTELPDELLERYVYLTRESLWLNASNVGMTEDEYTTTYMGVDSDTFVAQYAEEGLKQALAMQAIANREDLDIDEAELEQLLSDSAKLYGYASVEEYIGDRAKDDFREYYLYEKVMKFLKENAVIVE